jgi:hypothetical protein
LSRLDSFIRRMSAQRDCLNHACNLLRDLPGPFLEFGLGNGRTFDHIRECCPAREIFVFERSSKAAANCRLDKRHLIEGDVFETMPLAPGIISAPAAMAHIDMVGCGDKNTERHLASHLGRYVPPLMAASAIMLCDHKLELPDWSARPLPDGVPPGRYFYYIRGL